MKNLFKWLVPCLALFHSPDGIPLWIETTHIAAVRTAESLKEHLVKGTKSVIYTTVKTFAVIETEQEIQDKIDSCQHTQSGEA